MEGTVLWKERYANRGGKRMSLETVPLASDSPLTGKAMLGFPAKQVQPQNTLLKECLFFIKIFFFLEQF